MKRRILRSASRVLGAVALVVLGAWIAVAQPSCRRSRPLESRVEPARLREHVTALSERFRPRDWRHRENLDRCAEYIAARFREAGAAVEFQPFTVACMEYRNVIGRFAVGGGPRIVVGAHYDACGELPGADDNASGVAALIELAGLLGATASNRPVDVVAYARMAQVVVAVLGAIESF